MTDIELLELAAKAAGIELVYGNDIPMSFAYMVGKNTVYKPWNPLTDDGDALRLAVKLNIAIDWKIKVEGNQLQVWCGNHARIDLFEPVDFDPYAATRRAIVRAAAEIGKEMK